MGSAVFDRLGAYSFVYIYIFCIQFYIYLYQVGRAPLSLRAVGALSSPAPPSSVLIMPISGKEEGGRADGCRCPDGVGWS